MPEENNEEEEVLSKHQPTDNQELEPDVIPLAAPDSFEFVYEGPELAGGSMRAHELAELLSGLSRAFSVVAQDNDIGDSYELRVRDVDSGSFHILFEAVSYVKANPVQSVALATTGTMAWNVVKDTASGAYQVITDIAKAIDAKLALRGKRPNAAKTTIDDSGIRLELEDGEILLTREQYELVLSRRIDKPLSQIMSPLSVGRVSSFVMRDTQKQLTKVNASERDYFDYHESSEAIVKEGTEIVGTLNSLTKTSRRGTFHTSEGVHVPYRYVGGDDGLLLRGFASKVPVKITGRIRYDADGIPTSIEATSIEPLQRNLL